MFGCLVKVKVPRPSLIKKKKMKGKEMKVSPKIDNQIVSLYNTIILFTHWNFSQPYTTQSLRKKPAEKIMGKGKYAGKKHCLPSPTVLPVLSTTS